jgi:hypothetical protein
MIWLTWRHARVQALTAVLGLVVVGGVLAYTHGHLLGIYHDSGIQACRTAHGDCGELVSNFTARYSRLQQVNLLILVLPALIGIFCGAPLVARELESGTYRLAWTQSVTRTRWLALRASLVAAGSLLTVALFVALIAWWGRLFDAINADRLDPVQFSERGVVPLAYTAFAFSLGLAAGTVIRRVVPAMAVTLVAFFAVRVVVQEFVRGHLFAAPVHVHRPIFSDRPLGPNAWTVSSRLVDAHGTTVNPKTYFQARCGLSPAQYSKQTIDACASRLHVQQIYAVQPAHRYWYLQGAESLAFLVLAAGLIALAFWWLHRRPV